jgi:PAS domain S-box-containing protein
VADAATSDEAEANADRAAAEPEGGLERFFELSLDMLCVASFEGYFRRVNPAFERVLGYTAAELASEPFLDFVHPDDRAATSARLEALNEGVDTLSFENRYRRRDGTYRWLQWTSTPDLEHRLVYAVARDVTEAKRAEAELRTLVAAQSALRRVATLVAREGEHAEVFELVTEEVGRLLGVESASIVRFEPDGTGLVIGGWNRPGAPRLPPGSGVPLTGETASGLVHRTGAAGRVEAAGSLATSLRELGFRSAVGAPIRVEGRLWGALVASTSADDPLPDDAEKRLSDFAELVAQALANAVARDELAASRARIVEASDAERRRLERNLHDGAQQRLVTLALTLRLAEARLPSNPEAAGELLADARKELAVALSELRELAHGLHPAVLSERGLRPALEAAASRAPVPVELACVPGERFPEPVEVAAYYLVSEALTNVAKYAQATSARVAISRDDGLLVVEVADDGVGGANLDAGSGLRGLADRVGALAGVFEVESPAGRGTTVRATFPVS